MSAQSGLCENDFDCPSKLVCYKNVSWSEGETFCACDTWFGWSSEDCSVFGPQTIFWIVSHGLVVLIAGLSFTVTVVKCSKYVKNGNITLKWKRFTPVIQTFITLMLYFFCRSISSIFFLINVLDVEGFGNEYSLWSDKRKRGSMAIPVLLTQSLSIFLGVHANLSVALVWASAAYKAKRLLADSKIMKRFQNTIKFLQLFFTLLVVVILVTDFGLLFGAVLFLALIMLVLFTLARRWFKEWFSSDSILPALDNIRRASALIIFFQLCLLVFVVGITSFSLAASDSRDLFEPDKVSAWSSLYMLVELAFLGTTITILWYVSTVLEPRSTKKSEKNDGNTMADKTLITTNTHVIDSERETSALSV